LGGERRRRRGIYRERGKEKGRVMIEGREKDRGTGRSTCKVQLLNKEREICYNNIFFKFCFLYLFVVTACLSW
jgi:hypothetical protein